MGQYEEAIRSFDKALQLAPENAAAWNNRGVTLKNLELYDEAIKSFDNAIEINPDFAMAWNNKGKALSDLHRYNDALDCFEAALVVDPYFAGAWYRLRRDHLYRAGPHGLPGPRPRRPWASRGGSGTGTRWPPPGSGWGS